MWWWGREQVLGRPLAGTQTATCRPPTVSTVSGSTTLGLRHSLPLPVTSTWRQRRASTTTHVTNWARHVTSSRRHVTISRRWRHHPTTLGDPQLPHSRSFCSVPTRHSAHFLLPVAAPTLAVWRVRATKSCCVTTGDTDNCKRASRVNRRGGGRAGYWHDRRRLAGALRQHSRSTQLRQTMRRLWCHPARPQSSSRSICSSISSNICSIRNSTRNISSIGSICSRSSSVRRQRQSFQYSCRRESPVRCHSSVQSETSSVQHQRHVVCPPTSLWGVAAVHRLRQWRMRLHDFSRHHRHRRHSFRLTLTQHLQLHSPMTPSASWTQSLRYDLPLETRQIFRPGANILCGRQRKY